MGEDRDKDKADEFLGNLEILMTETNRKDGKSGDI
jgi:hypothetical protein